MLFCLCPSNLIWFWLELMFTFKNLTHDFCYTSFSPSKPTQVWTAVTFSKCLMLESPTNHLNPQPAHFPTKLHSCIGMCTRVVTQAFIVPWQALPSSIRRYPVWQVHWTSPLAIWHFWEQPPLFWLQLPSLERGPVCRTKHIWCHRLICYK